MAPDCATRGARNGTIASTAAATFMRLFCSCQDSNGSAAEGGEIVGLARGDEVAVDHDFSVFPRCAGVDHVVFDGKEGSDAAAFEHVVGGAETPAAVADGGNEFALRVDIGDELVGFGVTADMVGRVAAGGDETIEVRCRDFVVRFVGHAGVAQFRRVRCAGFRADGNYFRAGFAEAVERIPDFHFLVGLVHQNGDTFPFEFHGEYCTDATFFLLP